MTREGIVQRVRHVLKSPGGWRFTVTLDKEEPPRLPVHQPVRIFVHAYSGENPPRVIDIPGTARRARNAEIVVAVHRVTGEAVLLKDRYGDTELWTLESVA